MRKLAYVLAAVTLGAALAWAVFPSGQSENCTEMGCSSQVSFQLSTDLLAGVAYMVEACADDYCLSETLTVPEDRSAGTAASAGTEGLGLDTDRDVIRLQLPPDTDWEGSRTVSLRVVTQDGEVAADMTGDADFESMQPNGPGCPPVCWLAEVAA